MTTADIYQAMTQSIIDGEPEQAEQLAREALALGLPPLDAINQGFVPGINAVGQEFGCGQMFLPDLVRAGAAMNAAVRALEPEMARLGATRDFVGTVVLGTIKGDIHEIGKNLVATMFTSNGFQVFDLGVDAAPEAFVLKAQEVNANLVGISALLTTTMLGQRKVVEALAQAGLRSRVKVLIGGAPVTRDWAAEIGADGYSEDAIGAVRLAKELLGAPAA